MTYEANFHVQKIFNPSYIIYEDYSYSIMFGNFPIARWLRAKFWPDCAIPDTSMKFGTFVDHD